jgi:hypothetical protein
MFYSLAIMQKSQNGVSLLVNHAQITTSKGLALAKVKSSRFLRINSLCACY